MRHTTERAAAAWTKANDDAASTETGIETLRTLVRALAKDRSDTALDRACVLLALYLAHGTDPDGEATTALHEALDAMRGDPVWKLDDAAKDEVFEAMVEWDRDDTSKDRVRDVVSEWDEQDWHDAKAQMDALDNEYGGE